MSTPVRVVCVESARPPIPAPPQALRSGGGLLRRALCGCACFVLFFGVFSTGAIAQDVEAEQTARTRWNFENDIIPILTRFGCNTSGCHGKAEGQNGFKLSVFGFDPEGDYAAIVQEGRGRRVFPVAADRSLFLRKASGEVPHGGGVRLDSSRPEYARLRDWIASGVPFGSPDDPKIVRITVEPSQKQMTLGGRQRLQVTAVWSDGRQEDVSPLATYQTNNEGIANVDEQGVVTVGETPGVVAVMATYLGQVDLFQALIPRNAAPSEQVGELTREFPDSAAGRIDRLVASRLQQLNMAPSDSCDDATYLRRVSLDLLGTLPTSEEARSFLTDRRENKRELLVDRLLAREEFTDYQTLKWADVLRVNRRVLGRKGARAYYDWMHRSLSQNLPLDQFARELIAAEGPLSESPAGYFYKATPDPSEMANTISQVFLGVRIDCARCHHHPWDRWSQTDYFGMQAFFTQTSFKPLAGGEALVANRDVVTRHPRTGDVIFAHPLGTTPPESSPAGDRRVLLADWITSADNPWFARNLANRQWAHLMGRGLVEPVDDFRLTNPPSNPELLDELARQLVAVEFDLRRFLRTLVLTDTYQRACEPNATNFADEQNYSRYPMKRLEAEVLFDAVCQVTGVRESFAGVSDERRAIQLWDSHVPHDFLELFGRPVRESACECERVAEPTVGQVLHVLNSPGLHDKLRHAAGRLARLTRDVSDPGELVDEIYLTCFSRFPDAAEKDVAINHLRTAARRQESAEDLTWTLMNSLEFLFNH